MTQSGRRSPASLDSPPFVLDFGLFDGTLVGVDCERELTREPEANFRLGVLLPGMYDHFLSWDPQAVLRSATRTCPNFFVSESISRTFPDTHQRHGGFAGLARRFS